MAYIPPHKRMQQQFRFLKTYFHNFYQKNQWMAWRLLEELIDETEPPKRRRRRPSSTGGFVAEPVRTMEQKRAMVRDGIAQWDWHHKGEICF